MHNFKISIVTVTFNSEKTLKDEEELHFMGVNTDKKRSGDDYLFSVVNQDGKNRIEITK